MNMSNGSEPDLIDLSPAAVVAIVTWTDTSDTASSFWNRLWTRGQLISRLEEISARQLIPLLICIMVLLPEVVGSLRALKLVYIISADTASTIIVSANKGITLKILKDTYASLETPYVNHAIRAIGGLGASREKIANLDAANPFPALFLAPDPKGVWIWWDFSKTTNVPVGYRPSWQEVIGDACIVTEPKRTLKDYSEPLIKAVEPHLTTAFTVIYEDELLKVWRNVGCGTTGGKV
jgi:hypothetical protein